MHYLKKLCGPVALAALVASPAFVACSKSETKDATTTTAAAAASTTTAKSGASTTVASGDIVGKVTAYLQSADFDALLAAGDGCAGGILNLAISTLPLDKILNGFPISSDEIAAVEKKLAAYEDSIPAEYKADFEAIQAKLKTTIDDLIKSEPMKSIIDKETKTPEDIKEIGKLAIDPLLALLGDKSISPNITKVQGYVLGCVGKAAPQLKKFSDTFGIALPV